MFIYDVEFIGVWGSYWDQKHSGSLKFAWCVGHRRRLLIKTLTGREEWTSAENRGMTIGWWKIKCVYVCGDKKNKAYTSVVFVSVWVL